MGQEGSKDILVQGPSNLSVLLLKVLLAQTTPVTLLKTPCMDAVLRNKACLKSLFHINDCLKLFLPVLLGNSLKSSGLPYLPPFYF